MQSFNRYSYVWNNPLSYIDPTGNRRTDANRDCGEGGGSGGCSGRPNMGDIIFNNPAIECAGNWLCRGWDIIDDIGESADRSDLGDLEAWEAYENGTGSRPGTGETTVGTPPDDPVNDPEDEPDDNFSDQGHRSHHPYNPSLGDYEIDDEHVFGGGDQIAAGPAAPLAILVGILRGILTKKSAEEAKKQAAKQLSKKRSKKAQDSSKNERHGDINAVSKVEKQLAKLKEQLSTATGREKTQISAKIKKIVKNAAKKRKGETHGKRAKK